MLALQHNTIKRLHDIGDRTIEIHSTARSQRRRRCLRAVFLLLLFIEASRSLSNLLGGSLMGALSVALLHQPGWTEVRGAHQGWLAVLCQ